MTDRGAFRIRPMEGRDIPAVVALDRLVFRTPWPESAYVQEIYFNRNAHYFVLELVDLSHSRRWFDHRRQTPRLLGFVGMRVEGERGHISTLAVREDWRGHHFGEILLLMALHQAIVDNARVVGLEVRVSNDIAQHLYAKYGFQLRSQLRKYYADGEDAYYLQVNVVEDPAYRQQVQERLVALLEDLDIEKKDV